MHPLRHVRVPLSDPRDTDARVRVPSGVHLGNSAESQGAVPMTPADFGFALTLGLVSGLHCVQMCGPIALVVGPGRPLVLYNAGRIVTYGLLGAVAGSAGRALMLLGSTATVVSGG